MALECWCLMPMVCPLHRSKWLKGKSSSSYCISATKCCWWGSKRDCYLKECRWWNARDVCCMKRHESEACLWNEMRLRSWKSLVEASIALLKVVHIDWDIPGGRSGQDGWWRNVQQDPEIDKDNVFIPQERHWEDCNSYQEENWIRDIKVKVSSPAFGDKVRTCFA